MYDPESLAERLDRILRDLGYAHASGMLDQRRIARCIRDRAGLSEEQWPDRRVPDLVAGRRTMTADDLRTLSVGLAVPIALLAWSDPPKLPQRRARTFFDRIGRG